MYKLLFAIKKKKRKDLGLVLCLCNLVAKCINPGRREKEKKTKSCNMKDNN